jgi:hypothetical protein
MDFFTLPAVKVHLLSNIRIWTGKALQAIIPQFFTFIREQAHIRPCSLYVRPIILISLTLYVVAILTIILRSVHHRPASPSGSTLHEHSPSPSIPTEGQISMYPPGLEIDLVFKALELRRLLEEKLEAQRTEMEGDTE